MLAQERKLRVEKEEICSKQKMDLDRHCKEIDKQKTNIALLRAHLADSEFKMSEFQHQVRESDQECQVRQPALSHMPNRVVYFS
jgi:septal ring factor EnvC (AmiA/AmiB activator)